VWSRKENNGGKGSLRGEGDPGTKKCRTMALWKEGKEYNLRERIPSSSKRESNLSQGQFRYIAREGGLKNTSVRRRAAGREQNAAIQLKEIFKIRAHLSLKRGD